MKHLVVCIIWCGLVMNLLQAEPSVYGDGGFFSPQKEIVKNKKAMGVMQSKIAQQSEEIQGLKSIIEGLSASVREVHQNSNGQGANDSVLLKDLGMMIEKINADYVSKDDLQRALGSRANAFTSTKQISKPTESNSNHPLVGKSNARLYNEGVRLFGQKRYTEAKKRFTITDTKGHKTAASNYYLGEISYYTKRYEDAIFHFKKSAGLYDKATYMDILLLHTAVSLHKKGDNQQAKAFYENIVANHQGKKSASIAERKLKEL